MQPDSSYPPPPPVGPPIQPSGAPSGDGTPPPDYGFITQPPKPPRRGLTLPGNGSPLMRIVIVLGGLLVLLILFVVIKGLLSGGGNTQALTTVAQDQQEMIHIITNGTTAATQQQAVLSSADQNFAATAQLSLTSAQKQLVAYLKTNGKKISLKTLNLKISPAIDQQLTTAASNSTYDTTFKQVMQSKLTNYEAALKAAYKQTKGRKGRQLLSNEYNGAQLLLTQLNSPAS